MVPRRCRAPCGCDCVASDAVDVATGDTLRVRALLMRPAAPAYPGAWDLQRDAFYNGMAAYGFALGPSEDIARAPPASFAHWLQSLRGIIAARIAAVLPDSRGAIATTLLTGGGSAIPEADREAFRDSGLAHLLAIAGLHIGIVMGLFFAFSRFSLALSERAALHLPIKQIAAVIALVAGGAYMLLTGAHVPIIRSFSMACMVTLGVLVGRRALSLRGLALAMAVLILMAPSEVLGVSFQMSFSAVLALIAGYDALRPALARLYGDGVWWRRFVGHLVALALTSALAGIFSAPFGAYHFGHVQLYFVLANVAAVPLTAFWVMPAGLIALGLMPLHLEALALVPMGWGIGAILWIGRTVSSWPSAVMAVPHMPAWGLGVLSLGIAWLGLWRSRLRLAGVVAILLGLVSPALVRPPDLLVSADARLIAWHGDGGMFVQKGSGASRFTLESWQIFGRRMARCRFRRLGVAMAGRSAARRLAARCGRMGGWRWCCGERGGGRIARGGCWFPPSRSGWVVRRVWRRLIGSASGGMGRRRCGWRRMGRASSPIARFGVIGPGCRLRRVGGGWRRG